MVHPKSLRSLSSGMESHIMIMDLDFIVQSRLIWQENGVCPNRKMGLQTAMKLIAKD